jgi:hypothetical protein
MGTICYTISPAGARTLRTLCLPLKPFLLSLPVKGRRLANIGLDVVLGAAYPKVSAFACFPPLVVTPNDQANSTCQSRGT